LPFCHFPSCFHIQNKVCTSCLIHSMRASCPAHRNFLYFTILKYFNYILVILMSCVNHKIHCSTLLCSISQSCIGIFFLALFKGLSETTLRQWSRKTTWRIIVRQTFVQYIVVRAELCSKWY
jgi:hypothetical protein